MADARLRELERRALTGDVEAKTQAIYERIRAGIPGERPKPAPWKPTERQIRDAIIAFERNAVGESAFMLDAWQPMTKNGFPAGGVRWRFELEGEHGLAVDRWICWCPPWRPKRYALRFTKVIHRLMNWTRKVLLAGGLTGCCAQDPVMCECGERALWPPLEASVSPPE